MTVPRTSRARAATRALPARTASVARASGSAPRRSGAAGTASRRRFGLVHLVDAIAAYAKSARCANDLDRLVVLERIRQEFDSEPATLLRRGFDKAYRQVMEGV